MSLPKKSLYKPAPSGPVTVTKPAEVSVTKKVPAKKKSAKKASKKTAKKSKRG